MMKKKVCKHFNGVYSSGMEYGVCEKGVGYRHLVGGEDFGWSKRIPCFKKHETEVACEMYSEPTEEDLMKAAKEEEEWMVCFKKQVNLMSDIKKNNKWGEIGEDICPICNNKIHWSISKFNGHLYLVCETKGCICVME